MRTRIATVTVMVVAALFCGGCSRVIGEGAAVALGAKGNYIPMRPAGWDKLQAPLKEYSNLQLGPIEDSFGGLVPAALLRVLPGKFQNALADANLPTKPGGKTLLIRGKIYHYEKSGLFGNVFGPHEEVVARMELVDKKTGKVIAVANCIGRTNKSVNLGVDKKADGLVKGIVKWLASGYPKPE